MTCIVEALCIKIRDMMEGLPHIISLVSSTANKMIELTWPYNLQSRDELPSQEKCLGNLWTCVPIVLLSK